MTMLSIPHGWQIRCRIESKATSLAICAALLLFGTVSDKAIAQMRSGDSGWQNGQSDSSIGGNSARGRRIAQEKCAACHGADGNSPDPQFPKLAGQRPAYLYWQIQSFAHGNRRSEIMAASAGALSKADMADVARFFSRQSRTPDRMKDRRMVAVGERVFFSGMPSCAMCHGSAGRQGMPMMGMMGGGMMGSGMGNVPDLNGQHAAYIVGQLNRFTQGERQGTVMNRIAAGLSDKNKQAVAEYLSSRP